MKSSKLIASALGGILTLGALAGFSAPAKADTGSTAAIAVGAAAIVGALLVDNNSHRSYYMQGGHRHYVSNDTANYYRSHRGHMNGGHMNGGHMNGGHMNGHMDNNHHH